MKYKFESRVRYSEIGPDKNLTLNSIVNYFQDCSTFQSEALGLGLDNLIKQHHVWVLSFWHIVVNRYPRIGEEIVTSTWAYDFKGFYGSRNFSMTDEQGNILAYANSLWVLMDLESGRPTKINQEEIDGYGLEERLDMDYKSRKIPIPIDMTIQKAFPVRRYHIDTNNHVNNGQYIQMAREFIPEDFVVKQMRVEYKKQAVYGAIITPKVSCTDGTYTITLCDQEEAPYAVIEFIEEKP